ncbi:MAG: zinc-ribbon domain containing protein [Myxococcota bacterium]
MQEFQDRQLKCEDCSQDFTFTVGEQEFYARKGFQQEPKRCKPCREARRAQRGGAGGGGGDRDRDSGQAPRVEARSRSGRGGGGGGSAREMFDATCGRCGAPARVPFHPTPGRPVYCRNCYGGGAGGSSRGGSQGDS